MTRPAESDAQEMCGVLLPNDPIPGERPLTDERLCREEVPCAEHGTSHGQGIGVFGARPIPPGATEHQHEGWQIEDGLCRACGTRVIPPGEGDQ